MRWVTMKRLPVVLAVVLIPMSLGVLAVRGQNPPREQPPSHDDNLKGMMRHKLKAAQAVLEGLTLNNAKTVTANARELKKVGEDSQWKVSPNITYIKQSEEFVRLAEQLEQRAKENDLSGATLTYLRMTINCIECHKFVRDNRLPLDPRLQNR
jgi:hypothetical protein